MRLRRFHGLVILGGRTALVCALLAMLVIPCNSADIKSPDIPHEKTDRAIQAREYDNACRNIVTDISSGNAKIFITSLDKKGLLDRTFHGISGKNEALEKARTLLAAALGQAAELLIKNLVEDATLTFLRSRPVNGEVRALIRIDRGDRGLSYVDFVLKQDEQGRVRIIDWHDYAQGQLYSEYLKEALLLLPFRNDLLSETLAGEPEVDEKTMGQFAELARLSREKRYEEWMDRYKDLPDELKYRRMVLVTRVLVASAMGSEDDYLLALDDVAAFMGDDPTLSLMLLDHYVDARDYKAARKALDRLDQYTGGDAAIDLLKANVCLTEKDYSESARYAQSAIQRDAQFEDAYWTLLAVSVFSGDYKTAIDTLGRLEHNFGYVLEPNDIAQLNGYEDFAGSSVFSAWKEGKATVTR